MRVLAVGGSNTGIKSGWAKAIRPLIPEHEFENAFLGAVGSLFGLILLIKREREGKPKPDVIIFEYALNDTLLLVEGNITIADVWESLHAVATYCARHGIRLIFLCLSLRPPRDAVVSDIFAMNVLYSRVAKLRGVSECLTLPDILGEVLHEHYADPMHLAEEASQRVAEAVAARLGQDVLVPRGKWRRIPYSYVDARDARTSHQKELIHLKSSVFSGNFITLRRGETSYWPGSGRLVAILLRVTETSGFYRIRMKEQALRKNAYSIQLRNVSKLMVLHYLTLSGEADGEIVIDMPAEQEELMRLEHDLTQMEGTPVARFDAQTLDLNGVVFHRPCLAARLFPEAALRLTKKRIMGRL